MAAREPSPAVPAAPDSSDRDRLDELRSELGQVEWLSRELRARESLRRRVTEASLWTRLWAWTQ
ncbi:MAG: hypothetical protein IPH07_17825 [Deltaproteobacteria bacterium]|nr:hypothetical protein [Deltaproteobacteria bacterium]MBK8715558.1 hypothetical protein [Deltaproteobacteria bacterium]MBP7287160.1 hypothetical protein [Nannocystaceae bacterium]